MRDLKYLIAYSAPISAYLAVLWQGGWSFATVILAFGLIPLAELFSPISSENLSEEVEEKKSVSFFFDLLLYLNLPLHLGLLYLYFQTMVTTTAATWEIVGMTLSVGVVMGTIGINVAHELGHRTKKFEQIFAKILLATALYTHFNIEHNRGHHHWVGTPKDPATARLGEPLYLFWFRSIFGEYRSAWGHEYDRLMKEGKPVLSFSNEMIWFQVAHLVYLGLVFWLFGWIGVGFAIAVAILGILLLETVNYIEHYGVIRAKLESGRYERVTPRHSWNSNREVGRIFLYELTRHSDHHFKATRKYQVLRHQDEGMQLPYGYSVSMLVAMVPPLWFSLMNKRLEEVQGA